jgi:hypothetical protein
MPHVEAKMKLSRGLFGLTVIVAGCGRSIPISTATLQDASSTSSSEAPSPASTVCDGHRMQVNDMTVTKVPPSPYPWVGKFSLHVSGCGFKIGAMTWDMHIGDVYSFNGHNGNETDIEWALDKEPAIGDELFIGYGNANGGTGIHYEGLEKSSVPRTSQHGP